MPDPFNGYRYLSHLRHRWRFVVVVLLTAGAVSLGISLLLPAKYTGTVSVVIDPPAGGDSRIATAVSPIYLESLKTFEHFALSDQLFARAAERFQLRKPGKPVSIERLKREVLGVSIPRNTKVMEVAATHRDPQVAHALALYIAEEAVKLNRDASRAADTELAAAARQDLAVAEKRLSAARTAFREASQRAPTPAALKESLGRLDKLLTDVSRAELSIQLSYREPEDREGQLAERLRSQARELERQAATSQELLARRMAEINSVEAAQAEALTSYELTEKRAADVAALAGFRGERLSVLDPGIVPERPSSPNLPLNVAVALALGALFALLYLSVEYGYREQRAAAIREARWESSRP